MAAMFEFQEEFNTAFSHFLLRKDKLTKFINPENDNLIKRWVQHSVLTGVVSNVTVIIFLIAKEKHLN